MIQSHPIFLNGFEGDYIRKETWISAVINMVMSAVFFCVIFGTMDSVPVWGTAGFAFDFIPQSFICGFLSSLVPAIMTRRRIADRSIAPSLLGETRLPRSVIGLALVFGIVSTIIFAGLAATVLMAIDLEALDFVTGFLTKIVVGGAVGIAITPIAIHAVMIMQR